MKIDFSSNRLRKQMSVAREMQKTFGQLTRKLQRRLTLLASANNLDEIPSIKPERCHELLGKDKGTFSVDLSGNFRLLFRPNHNPVPLKDDGGIDLSNVTAITIIGVKDTH